MKKTSNLVFKISGDSEKGIRPKNEDNFYCGVNQAGQLLAIIADGIGSLENSEIVSKSVVQNYEKQFQKYMSISDPTEFFSSTNEIIWKEINKLASEHDGKTKKFGSTIVMCLVTGETLDVFNLGDSRAYQFIKSKKKWDKLTVDQTVENLIETEYAKKLSKIKKESENIKEDTEFVNAWFKNQKTKFHDSLHAITHCIDDISVIHKDFDHFVYQIHKGDILFLASDGCYHWTEREDINSLVSKSKKFDGVSKSLTELAIKNGSDDNSTAIVVLAE